MKRFIVLAALSCSLLLPFFFQPIDLTTEDLGRHLKNGELVLVHPQLLSTNFYSYTQPAFAFVNHHWLSGVIFYAIEKIANIQMLIVLYTLLVATAVCTVLLRVYRRAGLYATAMFAPFLVLFIAERHVVRPEGFGLVFLAVWLLMFDLAKAERQISRRMMIIFIGLQILWVNLHISFIFGLITIATYALPEMYYLLRRKKLTGFGRSLITLGIGMTAVSLINPNGIRGLLYPLNIFTNYGYDIVENKSLAFLATRIYDPGIQLYTLFAILIGCALIFRVVHKQRIDVGELLRVVAGLVLGFVALRNLPIFAVFSFPFLAETIRIIADKVMHSDNARESSKIFSILLASVSFLVIVLAVATGTYHPSISIRTMQLGYVAHQFESAEFFRSLNITGEMFNNYDIGSYLIYTQFPDHKVFVDNRPEAYSYDFFKKTYIPMQDNEKVWETELADRNFQSIFFGYHDLTPWAQNFLAARLQDPAWRVVYIDELAMIFVRSTPEHDQIIAEHAVAPQDLAKYLRISP